MVKVNIILAPAVINHYHILQGRQKATENNGWDKICRRRPDRLAVCKLNIFARCPSTKRLQNDGGGKLKWVAICSPCNFAEMVLKSISPHTHCIVIYKNALKERYKEKETPYRTSLHDLKTIFPYPYTYSSSLSPLWDYRLCIVVYLVFGAVLKKYKRKKSVT